MSDHPYIADNSGMYTFHRPLSELEIVNLATDILEKRVCHGDVISSPDETRKFLLVRLSHLEHEIFCCLFLDTRHRVISFDHLFSGTIDGASVHAREVVKQALKYNAAAVIFAHNHPSGVPEPSATDRRLTQRLKEALALVDIRVLDHIVIGGNETVSFAERGFL